MSIVRIGLGETKGFGDGYEAIFKKKGAAKPAAKQPKATAKKTGGKKAGKKK